MSSDSATTELDVSDFDTIASINQAFEAFLFEHWNCLPSSLLIKTTFTPANLDEGSSTWREVFLHLYSVERDKPLLLRKRPSMDSLFQLLHDSIFEQPHYATFGSENMQSDSPQIFFEGGAFVQHLSSGQRLRMEPQISFIANPSGVTRHISFEICFSGSFGVEGTPFKPDPSKLHKVDMSFLHEISFDVLELNINDMTTTPPSRIDITPHLHAIYSHALPQHLQWQASRSLAVEFAPNIGLGGGGLGGVTAGWETSIGHEYSYHPLIENTPTRAHWVLLWAAPGVTFSDRRRRHAPDVAYKPIQKFAKYSFTLSIPPSATTIDLMVRICLVLNSTKKGLLKSTLARPQTFNRCLRFQYNLSSKQAKAGWVSSAVDLNHISTTASSPALDVSSVASGVTDSNSDLITQDILDKPFTLRNLLNAAVSQSH